MTKCKRKYDHIKPGFVPRVKVPAPYAPKKRKPAARTVTVIIKAKRFSV